jgi:hypothetical protein
MADELTADGIRTLLKLEPNATCGFVQMTYLSTQSIGPADCRRRLPMPGRWDQRSTSW